MRYEKPHRFAGQTRINTFFPPYPSSAFDRFCRAVIDRRRVPYSTYLAVTGACPFLCRHCSYAGQAGRARVDKPVVLHGPPVDAAWRRRSNEAQKRVLSLVDHATQGGMRWQEQRNSASAWRTSPACWPSCAGH